MCKRTVIFLGFALALVTFPALADTPMLSDPQRQIQSQIEKLLSGVSAEDRSKILSAVSAAGKPPAKNLAPAAPPKKAVVATNTALAPPATANDPLGIEGFLGQNAKDSPYQKSNCQGFGFLLRQDWKDMGYGSCPDTVDKATGAQISYSDDEAVHNRIWAVHGTAAVLYNSEVPNKPDEYDLYHRSFGG
jgi:hypothetical protein